MALCKCCSPKVAFILRVIYASVGILIGVLVCIVFNLVFSNKAASFLGLSSSLLATHCLILFIYLYVKIEFHRIRPRVAMLCIFGIVGAIGLGVGLGTFIVFLGLGVIDTISHKELYLPESYYVVCVWAFANFKWGLTAFLYAFKTYRKVYETGFYRLHEDMHQDDNDDDDVDDDVQKDDDDNDQLQDTDNSINTKYLTDATEQA